MVECAADVVRRGRLRLFGHLKRKDEDDRVSTCKSFEVVGVRGRGKEDMGRVHKDRYG